jgi:hypothetical protein
MLQIENKDRFAQIIADALSKVELTTDAQTKKRWINAIARAVAEIEENGNFMSWMAEDKSLLIWSQKTDGVYTSNGVCQCRAFMQGVPCFHRAAARLVRIYLETESVPVQAKAQAEEIPYLKPTVQVKAERIAGIRIN